MISDDFLCMTQNINNLEADFSHSSVENLPFTLESSILTWSRTFIIPFLIPIVVLNDFYIELHHLGRLHPNSINLILYYINILYITINIEIYIFVYVFVKIDVLSFFIAKVVNSRRETDAGVYWCEARNELGVARSRNATLQVAGELNIS